MEWEDGMASNEEGEVDLPKVIDKIRKLFALGTSSNENEAAAAVAMAQKMLAKFDLTIESIEDLKSDQRTAVAHGTHVVQTVQGKPDGWKADLFEAVAGTSDTFTAYQHEVETIGGGRTRRIKKGHLIGFAHDVEMAGYALAFLTKEIERLAQEYADVMWAEIRQIEKANGITHQQAESYYVERTKRHPLKAKLYFIKGAAETVIRKLWEDYHFRRDAAARDNPMALVLVKRQAVEDFISMERYGKTKAQMNAEAEARMAKWREEHAEKYPTTELAVPTETEAQRRKREEREARENERYWDAQDRKRAAKEAAMDKVAYREGKVRGEAVTVRPGITDGPKRAGGLE